MKKLLIIIFLFALCSGLYNTLSYTQQSKDNSHLKDQTNIIWRKANDDTIIKAFITFAERNIERTKDFVKIDMKIPMNPLFVSTPKDWFSWSTPERWKNRHIVLDENSFRIIIHIKSNVNVPIKRMDDITRPKKEKKKGRIVAPKKIYDRFNNKIIRYVYSRKMKGHPHIKEYRYYKCDNKYILVSLNIFEISGKDETLSAMISQLQKHYGKYEDICYQIGELIKIANTNLKDSNKPK